jgi:ferredoxin
LSGSEGKRLRRLLGRAVNRAGRAVGSRLGSTDAPIADEALVEFRNSEGEVLSSRMVSTGTSLLVVARDMGIEIDHFCGGQCSCGTCRVKVLNGEKNLTRPSGPEQMVLGPKHLSTCGRLACQARVIGEVVVEVPAWF